MQKIQRGAAVFPHNGERLVGKYGVSLDLLRFSDTMSITNEALESAKSGTVTLELR